MLINVVIRFAILLWTLVAITATAAEADLLSFQFHGKVLAFVVSVGDPITASVHENSVANLAVSWATRFYGVGNLNIDEIELRTGPTRFWLVRLSASDGSRRQALYAVVLPDGSIVEPVVREWL